jgi:hypothetical protein
MDGVAGDTGSPHDRSMDARIAVLEEIAAATKDGIADLRLETRDANGRIDAMRGEMNRRFEAMTNDMNRRFDAMRGAQEHDFRIMFSALITTALGLAALMAKGFHWF